MGISPIFKRLVLKVAVMSGFRISILISLFLISFDIPSRNDCSSPVMAVHVSVTADNPRLCFALPFPFEELFGVLEVLLLFLLLYFDLFLTQSINLHFHVS